MNRWQSSQPLQAVTKGWLRLVRLRVWLSEHFAPSEWQITLFWAALVGVFGGLSSLVFREALAGLHYLLTGSREEMVESFAHLPPWQRIGTPIVGGLLTGVILIIGRRFAKKRSTTDYMEA